MLIVLGIYMVFVSFFALIGIFCMAENARYGEDDVEFQIGKILFSWSFFPPMAIIKMFKLLVEIAKENSEDE